MGATQTDISGRELSVGRGEGINEQRSALFLKLPEIR